MEFLSTHSNKDNVDDFPTGKKKSFSAQNLNNFSYTCLFMDEKQNILEYKWVIIYQESFYNRQEARAR